MTKKIGSQSPRIKVEPSRTRTDGGDAAILMAAYGNSLDPWQQGVVDCWLGHDKSGNYSVTSAGLALPRQNGKNVCLEAREFFGMVVNGEKILHTAHQVRTAKKSFNRLARMFQDPKHPEVVALVKNVRRTNGEEAIELKNGGLIEFSARSRQAARGFDGISLIIYDEAQELTDDQLEAIMATLAASATGTRQIIYAGTPPYPGCPGTVFRRRRTVCLQSPGEHDAWHEWSVEGEDADSINVEDIKLWYQTNPALGIHLTEDFTAEELRSMTRDGFARERLGWWSPVIQAETDYVLNLDAWAKCVSEETKPTGKTAYGVKFSADGASVCLCGAVIPSKGPARISLIKEEPTAKGIHWLASWLNERYEKASCVVIDGRNGVDLLIEHITPTWRTKGSIVRPTARDVIAAASALSDAVNEANVSWYKYQERLNESATTSIKRPISGGFGFGGDNSSPIEACALAYWGARTSKRDPKRKMRIG
jgi:phage terminase large subunit-like protein